MPQASTFGRVQCGTWAFETSLSTHLTLSSHIVSNADKIQQISWQPNYDEHFYHIWDIFNYYIGLDIFSVCPFFAIFIDLNWAGHHPQKSEKLLRTKNLNFRTDLQNRVMDGWSINSSQIFSGTDLLPGIFNVASSTDLKNSNSTHFIQGFQTKPLQLVGHAAGFKFESKFSCHLAITAAAIPEGNQEFWQQINGRVLRARHILQVGLSSSAKHKHMAFSNQLQSAEFVKMSYRPKQHSLLSLIFQSFIGF